MFTVWGVIIEKLQHIENLSNYTIVLVYDIVQYVSCSSDLKIFKQEINLREVIIFCNNVLKTLVECNEMKADKIETLLEIDDNIDHLKIISDENRLKQILLNLISNSVKFTQTGFIKLKAKYITEKNTIEISVKDTGIGIKEDDNHLIFQENIELNIEQNYNVKGSGLGLSIVKSLANSLAYKISFDSEHKKGSKFRLELYSNEITKNSVQTKKSKFTNLENFEENNDFCHEEKKSMETPIMEFSLRKSMFGDDIDRMKNEKNENCNDELFQTFNFGFTINVLNSKESNLSIVVVDDHKLVRENTVNLVKNVFSSLNIANLK